MHIARTTLGAAVLLAAGLPLSAQQAPRSGEALTVHPEAQAAIDGIRSPYCPGLMLEVCTSAGGAMLRDSIQRLAEAGLDADSIIERVIAGYGEEWRAEPKRSGTGALAWALPPVALLLGSGLVAGVLARRGRSGPAAVLDAPDAEQEARLREALRALDEEEAPEL